MTINIFVLLTLLLLAATIRAGLNDCQYEGLSFPVAYIVCSVQNGNWFIDMKSSAIKNVGCLLGAKKTMRCDTPMKIPTSDQVPPSPSPPDAKIKEYQALATIAEKLIPQTWWRQGFASSLLLLTHNDTELPRRLLDVTRIRNKKLKNLVQCVTRQQFIRKSFSFQSSQHSAKCKAASEPVVKAFFKTWKSDLGYSTPASALSSPSEWSPNLTENGKMLVSALEVLDYFYQNYGGVWTGCFQFDDSSSCRGALAAAALVVSTNIVHDIGKKHKEFSESSFAAGYLLVTLGRGLLHGDSDTVGLEPVTVWGVRCADFIALQAAYMKLYIESFGAIYNDQLNKNIPLTFTPDFPILASVTLPWKEYALSLEPVYSSMRNWMFTEASNLIDFGPYRTLLSFPQVRQQLHQSKCRRVLIDVGANGFFASPKYLLDSYAFHIPFTDAIMIEPEPHFSANVPTSYTSKYNITQLQIYAEVNTGSDTDMIKLLPRLVTKEDFVVLKFDVDPNRYAQGPTMEWGFLFSLMMFPEVVELIDELYIELHFHFPALYWKHLHSNWEALDAIRYLRSQGVIVHSWP